MIRGYDSLVPFSLNPSPNEIPFLVNYQFPKSTKAYDQGQKMLFCLKSIPHLSWMYQFKSKDKINSRDD